MEVVFGVFPDFEKHFKKLLKKYKSMKNDILELKKEIQENPNMGVSLGEGLKFALISLQKTKEKAVEQG